MKLSKSRSILGWSALLSVLMSGWSFAATPVWDKELKGTWGNWAVGPELGQLMGISTKYWERKDRAVDAGVGYAWDKYFVIHADYLFQFPKGDLLPYAGGGIEYSYATNESKADKTIAEWMTSRKVWGGAGFRFPLGFEWLVSHNKIGLFAEFVPGIGVVPETFLILRGGAGFRVYL